MNLTKLKKIFRKYGDRALRDVSASPQFLDDFTIELIDALEIQLIDDFLKEYKNTTAKGVKLAFNKYSKSEVKQIINHVWCDDGRLWSDRVWTNIAELRRELTYALLTNQKPSYIKQKFNVSYHRAETLLRTEHTRVASEAAIQRYKDSGITKYKVLANQAHVCDICGKDNGKIFSIDERNPIPQHPNCRCTVVPII